MKKAQSGSAVTIIDVAKLAGVSIMTVSRVINASATVSEEMESRVRAAITKLGYRPNEAARMLKGQRSRTIGLILPDIADNFFANCASAVQHVAAKHGYMTLITSSERDEVHEADEIRLMSERNIAGLIMVPTRTYWKSLQQLASSGIPIIALDRPLAGIPSDEVTVENAEGARLAVRHLIGHGHKQIACIGYDSAVLPVSDRIRGYEATMREAGLSVETHADLTSSEAIEAFLRTWGKTPKKPKKPAALFILNNVTTIHTLLALQRMGLKVPTDYAIIGFDDLPTGPLFRCPLTVIYQSGAEMGSRAANLLFERLSATAQSRPLHAKTVLPVELVIRESCGCKPVNIAGAGRRLGR